MARYTIDGIEYPSVTQITGLLDKSDSLIPWAVKQMGLWITKNTEIDGDCYKVTAEQLAIAQKEFREVSDEAKDIGSEVHNMIEYYIKAKMNNAEPPKYDGEYRTEVENGFLAFLEWEKQNVKSWIECEQ